ncbi:tetratricopeptide repeat protein [Chitinophaga sancti]|uniref:Putative zinc-finger n=1 Tax=Chitinophaga sancti TaxID=1004 RepID=A0A1K1MJG6_9BACT|nr:tetratricopeptide repeat protein [Chitinophaga sancti]WQD62743.1 tetratricopeptide repeat protein [Chitinophaga sancti]WQG91633.1 tetratricopeptide repeat protein [Chitinophaga sancti]SFW23303.1 Putative zinc-finger [Chitinophaga sancti]
MSSNLENNDKILKIFSTVRCMSRDQLPRYLDGRLTDLEKHLLEQHLVDCDLCFDALQTLSQAKYREQYQPLSVSISQYIRNSIRKVSTTQKVERYQRLEQKKESFLIYFWVVAAVALGAGGVYLIQQQNKLKALNPSQPIAAADKILTPIPTSQSQPATVSQTETAAAPVPSTAVIAASQLADTLHRRPAPAEVKVVPIVKKDTIQAASATPKPAPLKDSAKKTTPAAEQKEEKSTLQPAKETPAPVAEKVEKKETPPPPKKEKKKDDDDDKKGEVQPSGTDEFLYKAAMVYHQQGDLNEAISRYKHLTDSKSKYGELSRYQLAVCYRSKGQTGKARRMFKEVVRMNGPMKEKAQSALDSL